MWWCLFARPGHIPATAGANVGWGLVLQQRSDYVSYLYGKQLHLPLHMHDRLLIAITHDCTHADCHYTYTADWLLWSADRDVVATAAVNGVSFCLLSV